MAKIIFSASNTPFPIIHEFTPLDNAPAVYYLSGSVYSREAGMVGLQAFINDKLVATAQIYSNAGSVHRALAPAMGEATVAFELQMVTVDGIEVPKTDKDGNLEPLKAKLEIRKLNNNTITNVDDNVLFARL